MKLGLENVFFFFSKNRSRVSGAGKRFEMVGAKILPEKGGREGGKSPKLPFNLSTPGINHCCLVKKNIEIYVFYSDLLC